MSYWSAAAVFDLSSGNALLARSVFLALVVGGPASLPAPIVELFNMPAMRLNGTRVSGGFMFGLMIWFLYIRVIVPILGVFYGTSLIADEVDDKTITYLFTRPIPRGAVLVGKYLAYLACTVLIVLPSVMLVYFLVASLGGGSIAGGFIDLLKDLGLIGLGLAAYGAVFAFVGAQMKRPLVVGLVFAFGWETSSCRFRATCGIHGAELPAGTGAACHALGFGDGRVAVVLPEQSPDLVEPAWVGAITAAGLALGARAVSRREYVLEQ